MVNRRIKVFYFIIEGVNSLACSYYANYLFFLLRDQYGFSNLGNLSVSALHGLVFAFSAWQGGRFAQRRGYFNALRVGFIGMAIALVAASQATSIEFQLLGLAFWTAFMCLTWPALEAVVSEGEKNKSLQQAIGVYNIVWSGAAALAYFLGGAAFEKLGRQSIFWLPTILYLAQWGVVEWLAMQSASTPLPDCSESEAIHSPESLAFQQPVSPRSFLKMAWLANPFAYVGINTVLATIPGLARQLNLSTAASGVFCSIWFFARMGTFALLWRWTGWHYRFRWLLVAFLGLLAGFLTLLLSRHLWVLVLAQLVFGFSVGLIYYSSLFYSMDVGETKGEHGGLHEAAIGVGICAGPAVGAAGLWLAPHVAQAGAYAVGALLLVGLAGLIGLRLRRRNSD